MEGRLTVIFYVHCRLLRILLFLIERMTSLQDQLIAIEARLDVLFAADQRDSALITSVEARAASLRERLILAETQRGGLSISIS
jgi:capsule polysaccharide export protein KpsE/RkpR